jgi:hypothetical protein
MKKVLFFSVILLLFGSCKNNLNCNLKVETIWSNYLKSFGDTNKIKNIKTIKCTTEFVENGKVKGISKTILKEGNKIYITYESSNIYIVTKYDGQNFIRFKNGEPAECTQNDKNSLIRACDFFHEIHYKEHGYKINLVGMENVENVVTYKVKYYSENDICYYYIDTTNFKVIKIEDKYSQMFPVEIKDKEGIRYFSKMKSIDSYCTTLINLNSIEFNQEVNDSIFR